MGATGQGKAGRAATEMLSLIATRNPCSGPLAAPGISVRAYHAPSGLSAGAGKELLRPEGAVGAVSAYSRSTALYAAADPAVRVSEVSSSLSDRVIPNLLPAVIRSSRFGGRKAIFTPCGGRAIEAQSDLSGQCAVHG